MSKTKEFMINNMTESEMNDAMDGHIKDLEYQQWLESEDYVNMVNEEIDMTTPKYSYYDIKNALDYAKSHIVVEASEIGNDVYDTLFSEKVLEYLNEQYER